MEGQTDGLMDGQTDEHMDGWVENSSDNDDQLSGSKSKQTILQTGQKRRWQRFGENPSVAAAAAAAAAAGAKTLRFLFTDVLCPQCFIVFRPE